MLRVTQLVKAELGFKFDPDKHAFSRLPWPTNGSPLLVVLSTIRIYGSVFETLLFPFRIGLAKGTHFTGCSLGMWLLHATQVVTVTQKVVDTAHLSLHFSLMCKWRVVRELRKDTWLFAHCLSYISMISFRLPYSIRRYELLPLYYR